MVDDNTVRPRPPFSRLGVHLSEIGSILTEIREKEVELADGKTDWNLRPNKVWWMTTSVHL